MSTSSDNNPVDQQYLKALGVDLWVPRDHEVPEPVVTPAAPAAAQAAPAAAQQAASVAEAATPVQAAPVGANKPYCDWSAAELSKLLPDVTVTPLKGGNGVEILVVTDTPAPLDESSALLGAMLKAINVSVSQWSSATIEDTATDSLKSFAATVDPQSVVLMLSTRGNPAVLDRLRGQQYQLPALNTFVMVTFHPQDLIDNPELKRPAWEDLKQLRQWLG